MVLTHVGSADLFTGVRELGADLLRPGVALSIQWVTLFDYASVHDKLLGKVLKQGQLRLLKRRGTGPVLAR